MQIDLIQTEALTFLSGVYLENRAEDELYLLSNQ